MEKRADSPYFPANAHTARKEHFRSTRLLFDCGDFTLLRKKHISLHNTVALWILDTKIVTEKLPLVTITEISFVLAIRTALDKKDSKSK